MSITLEQIKLYQPAAVSFSEGKSNYIITLQDGAVVMMNKAMFQKKTFNCFECGQQIVLRNNGNGYKMGRWDKFNLDGSEHVHGYDDDDDSREARYMTGRMTIDELGGASD